LTLDFYTILVNKYVSAGFGSRPDPAALAAGGFFDIFVPLCGIRPFTDGGAGPGSGSRRETVTN